MKRRTSKGRRSRILSPSSQRRLIILFLIFLALSIPLLVFVAQRPTVLTSDASKETVNLNNPEGIGFTDNADGTMGPLTAADNFSSDASSAKLGTVSLNLSNSEADQTMTDDPQKLTSLLLTLTKAEVHLANPENEKGSLNGYWETLDLQGPKTLDLFSPASGADTLALTKLSAGSYDEARLYIKNGTVTFTNGKTLPLTILGRDNIIRIVRPFTILPGKTTQLQFIFNAGRSLIRAGDAYILKPVVVSFEQNTN